MGKLIYFCPNKANMVQGAEEFFNEVKNDDLDIGIVVYRRKNGSVGIRVFDPEWHDTEMIGLLEQAKYMILTNEYWEEESD